MPGRLTCFLAIPAIFLAGFIPVAAQEKKGAASDSGRVTFVAYNLWNYLAMERRVDGEVVEDAGKPEEQVQALIAAITNAKPDILGVCELGDQTFLADLQSRLKEAGIDLPHTELVTSASGYNRNLALLSRFPIVARNSRDDLSYKIGKTQLPFQRGILDVTIAPNDSYRLRCVGLHLKSKRDVPEADQEEMRRNEAHLARTHIDNILKKEPGANLLVYGDLNDDPNNPPVKALRGRFGTDRYLFDLKPADKFGFRWTHHWSYQDIYARLDYAMVNKGLSPEIDRDASHILHPENWNLASDHRPLVIYLMPKDKGSK